MVDWRSLEDKWQARWEEAGAFEADPDPERPKYYITVAYPYPNSPQHIGHGRTYTMTDVHARYMRMKGYNVLFPMAWHFTGTPLFAMVERLKARDPELVSTFLTLYKIPVEMLPELETPVSMANYFAKEIKHGMRRIGYSIDWRREFTTVDRYYSKFIEWQFAKLKQRGYITQGSHPVGWCSHCGNPVGQHDTVGDKEPEIEEYTLIKFRMGEDVFPAATLRPETVFGVTNMWLNPDAAYVEAKVEGETWVISAEAVEKLRLLGRKVRVTSEFQGSRLIGQKLVNPATGREIVILPAPFVNPRNATGVVMSVPAHAPFDYVALEQLKEDVRKSLANYKVKATDVSRIEPVSVIDLPGWGESPAVDIVKRMGIIDQNDPRLEKATKEVYSSEFHGGRMRGNTGSYASMNVQQAKEAVKQDLIEQGNASTMYELVEPVMCRCGTEVVVKIFENQWFINYGDPAWKRLAKENIDNMEIIPPELRQEFYNIVDWLKAKACARKAGLGTRLPWAKDWIIEALSDSTIYMAYYTVVKGLYEMKPEPEQLTEQFWDYVFLGQGSAQEVAEKTGIMAEKVEELRTEFDYFYPLDSRHSGRDLIPNHLTFMVFIHDAIWSRQKWPRGIMVNGSVLMEGQKMSKSLNNIVPLIKPVDEYGSDPLRLSLMITAEPLKDADFSPELARNMVENLERFNARANEIIEDHDKGDYELEGIDLWMLSRLQSHIADADEAMKEMRVRKTIHAALYDLNQDLEWYMRRVAFDRDHAARRKAIVHVKWTVLDAQVRLLAPFIPHLCEEIWEQMGNENFVAYAPWPTVDGALIREDAEELESITRNCVEDVQNIVKVTGIKPATVHFYVADGWKWKLMEKAMRLNDKGALDVGNLIREAFKDEEMKTKTKEVPAYARVLVDEIKKMPEKTMRLRRELGYVNETALLEDASSFLRAEFGCDVEVSSESDPWIKDPAKRAGRAKPFRPAIYVE